MTEIQILSALKNNNGSMQYTDLLNLNMTDPFRDPLADEARITQMIKDELLTGRTDAYHNISITDNGRLYLQNAAYLEDRNKQLADKAADDKAKKNRHNWSIAVVGGIIGGLVGFVFDLIIALLFS